MFVKQNSSGGFFVAPKFVQGDNYELSEAGHAANSYPVDGWYWFTTAQEAYDFFGIPSYNETDQQLQDRIDARAYAKLTALKVMTPAQVKTWVTNNVTTLAQAQDAIATLAIAVSILARQI